MNWYNYNGKLVNENTAVIGPNSRALRYGDGLFETIKYRNGQILLEDEHFARLWKGMEKMHFEFPKLFTPEKLREEINKTIQKNKHTDARVRMAIIRGDGGMFDPKNHLPNFIIQSWQLPPNIELLNSNGLNLCIYKEAYKACDAFCNIKHNNYLPYFMAALFAKEKQCNDAFVLNDQQRICDSSIANVYIIKDGVVHTPALTEGCIEGVMRYFLLKELPALGFTVKETELTEEMLLNADEVFLSNSIFNIRWVGQVEQKKYTNSHVQKIVDALHQNFPDIFH
ncbi:MAG: aminotransferase class IV [Ferruginibacter sp.]